MSYQGTFHRFKIKVECRFGGSDAYVFADSVNVELTSDVHGLFTHGVLSM